MGNESTGVWSQMLVLFYTFVYKVDMLANLKLLTEHQPHFDFAAKYHFRETVLVSTGCSE